ncbi:MAG: penicillin-binding protein 2 [Elusimicrobia bacterium]|nr:penicillin-binding protein 2 [Elusimicrobiota bacterium]
MRNFPSSGFSAWDDRRIFLLSSLGTAAFALLVLRLFFLQVVRGPEMARQADLNRTQILPLLAPRGLVWVRNGSAEEVVLENAPRFSVFYSCDKKAGTGLEKIEAELRARLPGFESVIRRKLNEARKSGKITRVLSNVPTEAALALLERRVFLPGVNVLVEPQRRARYGSLACHVLGYAGEVDESELKRAGNQSVRSGQWIGKSGLEKAFDGFLRGIDGGLQFEVDAAGRHVQVVQRIASVPGNDLHLTLDRRIQSAAEAGLAASVTGRGAAVAVDPVSGAILAMASSPGYDPSAHLGDYLGNPALPFFNRAIQGVYPPGSIFKIVTAAAGLNQIQWDTRQTFFCAGLFELGNREFGCWSKHGRKDFWGAVAWSCNVYFYNLGRAVGVDAIESLAKEFGLGEKSELDIPGESTGLIPGRTWKKSVFRQNWFEGDTLNLCIGQGAATVTPLQAAVYFGAVANRGTVWKPYTVDRVTGPDNRVLYKGVAHVRHRVDLRETVWDNVHRAVEGVAREGSGRVAFRPDLKIGAKTGTAQNPHGDDHAWFAAFAGRPGEPPGLALAVFVENGGHGSAAAGPIARDMINAFYPPPDRP